MLSVPETTHIRVLHERMVKISDKSVCDHLGELGRGRKCMDQIVALKIIIRMYLEAGSCLVHIHGAREDL